MAEIPSSAPHQGDNASANADRKSQPLCGIGSVLTSSETNEVQVIEKKGSCAAEPKNSPASSACVAGGGNGISDNSVTIDVPQSDGKLVEQQARADVEETYSSSTPAHTRPIGMNNESVPSPVPESSPRVTRSSTNALTQATQEARQAAMKRTSVPRSAATDLRLANLPPTLKQTKVHKNCVVLGVPSDDVFKASQLYPGFAYYHASEAYWVTAIAYQSVTIQARGQDFDGVLAGVVVHKRATGSRSDVHALVFDPDTEQIKRPLVSSIIVAGQQASRALTARVAAALQTCISDASAPETNSNGGSPSKHTSTRASSSVPHKRPRQAEFSTSFDAAEWEANVKRHKYSAEDPQRPQKQNLAASTLSGSSSRKRRSNSPSPVRPDIDQAHLPSPQASPPASPCFCRRVHHEERDPCCYSTATPSQSQKRSRTEQAECSCSDIHSACPHLLTIAEQRQEISVLQQRIKQLEQRKEREEDQHYLDLLIANKEKLQLALH